eukprot:7975442-Karenia_brevis.AAC.1
MHDTSVENAGLLTDINMSADSKQPLAPPPPVLDDNSSEMNVKRQQLCKGIKLIIVSLKPTP